ncbi:MAG: nucleotidyltransferase family protein [Candidatus Aenigmarchaeota archaeon]|nr:nucleotidyltransferase family protein [Candidatus Aenigmarchaeota archaeon]
MKCILLCGGFAKRLWPMTLSVSKPLLEVGGKPVINYILEKLETIKGIDSVLVSTNARFERDYTSWKAKYHFDKPVHIIIEDSRREEEKLGAIGGVHYVLSTQRIQDDCMIIAGDNLIGFDVADFVECFRKKKHPVVAAFDLKDRSKARLYGILKVDGTQRVVDFVEKPQEPASTLASTGCYLFPRASLHYFGEYLSEGNHKDAPGFFLQWLHKREAVYAYIFENNWFDIGDKDSLSKARTFMKR